MKLLYISISLILLMHINIIAQETTPEPEIITNVRVSYFSATTTDIVDVFFQSLEAQLAENDLTLEIVELETGDPMLHILFRPLNPRGPSAQTEADTVYVLNPLQSPFEYPSLTTILTDRAVIIAAPPEISAQFATGLLLFIIGNCETNTTDLFIALQGAVENPAWEDQLNFYLGNCALINEEYQTAIDFFSLVQNDALNNPYWSPAINTSFAYIMLGESETGFQLLEDLIALLPAWSPDIADVLTRRAMLYALTNNQSAALNDFETALTTNPNFAPCFYYRGIYYADLGQFDAARADLQRYLELAPEGEFAESALEYLQNL
ncbi:MAG: hypothetical protein Kow00117_15520 [Phototrophicales bacterium]